MVIVLFLLVLLLFPIKFNVKIRADVNNAYFCIGFFFFKLLIVEIRIVDYNRMLYFTISRFKPKKIKIKNQDKKVNIPINYDFFKGERVKINLLFGSINSAPQIMGILFLRIILPKISQIIDDRLEVRVGVDFMAKGVKVLSNITLFTSLGIVILGFIKKAIKGVKYATQQPH